MHVRDKPLVRKVAFLICHTICFYRLSPSHLYDATIMCLHG